MTDEGYSLVDLDLAARLERTEAQGSANYVAARGRQHPSSGATWIEVAGAYAMFDGADSPLTQTFGLGMFGPISPEDLDRIEAFYEERDAPVFHEVSPLADPSVLALLNARRYHPIEFTNLLHGPSAARAADAPRNPAVRVRLVRDDEEDVLLWARIAAEGWSDHGDVRELLADVARVNAERDDTFAFLAELDGNPIAAASYFVHNGVAMLAGASTVPDARRQGAQLALLDARLALAAEQGCDLAMMGAQPGSASQRNAERHAFRIAYTRIKWQSAID